MTESASPVQTTAYLPFHLDRPLDNLVGIEGNLPWAAPAYVGFRGTSGPTSTIPTFVIAYEWPAPWSVVLDRMPKDEIERTHLESFNGDHVIARGKPAFSCIASGNDPPDFRIRIGKLEMGLDCAALTVPGRRDAHGLLIAMRRYLMRQDRSRFAHLSGHVVYIWFGTPVGSGLPFRPTDRAALDELARALEEYRAPPSPPTSPNEVGAVRHALPREIRTSAGATFYAMPMQVALPTTMFFNRLGFEIGLAHTTTHEGRDAWAEVEKLVADHDKPGIDWLLLSAGAPSRDGYLYFTEEAFAEFLLTCPRLLTGPRYIRRVLLHFWTAGRAVDLFPNGRDLFGPLYEGTVLPHRKLPGLYATRVGRAEIVPEGMG